MCVFNQPVDYFGSANGVVVQWYDATGHDQLSVDLTGVSHEVGHGLGLEAHSRLEGSAAEYADPWDIMSAYSGYHDLSGTATPPGSPYYTFGPGLNAVNMELLDGLDPARVFQSAGTSSTFTLRPLHRRELSGWLAAKVQIGYETLYVEFRLREGWDASIPAACILLHRHAVAPDGEACSELVVGMPTIRAQLLEGDSYEAGEVADPFGLYARITATRLDVEAREAVVDVYVRSPRRAPQARPFGGVTRDGGGFIWVPGRGLVPIPPRSPLLEILELLAEYETLEGLSRGPDTHALALNRLERAREQLAGLVERRTAPKVPSPPLRRPTE